jgi:TRAP-type C4-dicarboxylate transport system permease small subunit
MTLRRTLDALYDGAGVVAGVALIGTLVFVLIGIAGRLFHFHLPGTDAYAGYCMAAAGFLALAHTLKRGEHIRVSLLLERFGPRVTRALELWSHAAGSFFCIVLTVFCVRLVWQSWSFNDVSQGNDATPLWIPQIAMAAGAIVLAVAMFDDFVLHVRHRHRKPSAEAQAELKLME